MDALTKALLGVLGETLGQNPSELEAALITSNESGEPMPLPEEKVKSYLSDLLSKKYESVGTIKADQIRGRSRKEAFEKVEKTIQEKFGIESASWEDGIAKIFEQGLKQAKNNPKDIKTSEIYLQDTQALRDQIKEANEKALHVEKDWRKRFIMSEVERETNKIIQNPDNKFVLPPSDSILQRSVKNLMRDLGTLSIDGKSVNVNFVEEEDGTIHLRDEEGQPVYDKKTMHPISLKSHILNTAKTGYFLTQTHEGRGSAGSPPGKVAPGTPQNGRTVQLSEGKQIELPKWDSKDDYNTWYLTEGRQLPKEARSKAMEVAATDFPES